MNAGRDRDGSLLGRPTDFTAGAYIEVTAPDRDRTIRDARSAIEAGADFLVTSPIFDFDALDSFLGAAAVPPHIPVLASILLLRDAEHAEYLHQEVPGMRVPDLLRVRLRDDGAGEGLAIARELMGSARVHPRLRGVVVSSDRGRLPETFELLRSVAEVRQ
jgi:homocysteine S-methyltransferase